MCVCVVTRGREEVCARAGETRTPCYVLKRVCCAVCVCVYCVCLVCSRGRSRGRCVSSRSHLFVLRSFGLFFLTSTITARAFAFTARKGGEQAVDAVVRGDGEGVSTSTVYSVWRVQSSEDSIFHREICLRVAAGRIDEGTVADDGGHGGKRQDGQCEMVHVWWRRRRGALGGGE